MAKWIIAIITCFAITAYSCEISKNSDGIGTFLGGENPFPWGQAADLPNGLGGIWEVREADDGAYFIINEEIDEASGKPKININLLDPCTLEMKASGTAYVRDGVLQATLVYPDSDLRVKLKLQAFMSKSSLEPGAIQVVLMVMNPSQEKKMDKYFPVSKVSIPDVVEKCK